MSFKNRGIFNDTSDEIATVDESQLVKNFILTRDRGQIKELVFPYLSKFLLFSSEFNYNHLGLTELNIN